MPLRKSGPIYERDCNALDHNKDEAIDELTFVYGVESTEPTYELVDDIEDWIIYYIAKSSLGCVLGTQSASFLRGNETSGFVGAITKIEYSQDNSTTWSRCLPESIEASDCAVLRSTLIVASRGVPATDLRRSILADISQLVNNGTLINDVPNIVTMSYLGPDPQRRKRRRAEVTQVSSALKADQPNGQSGWLSASFAVLGCVLVSSGIMIYYINRRKNIQ